MIRIVLTSILVIVGNAWIVNAQNQTSPTHQVKSTDWLKRDYKYLNQQLKPIVPSEQFDEWKKKYRFKPGNIMDCSDSLKVILPQEQLSAPQVRSAALQICYSWERASWSLLLPASRVKEIALKYGFASPYKLIDQLRTGHASQAIKEELLDNFDSRLAAVQDQLEIANLTEREKMKLAFQYSPQRLKVVDSILASQGSSRRQD